MHIRNHRVRHSQVSRQTPTRLLSSTRRIMSAKSAKAEPMIFPAPACGHWMTSRDSIWAKWNEFTTMFSMTVTTEWVALWARLRQSAMSAIEASRVVNPTVEPGLKFRFWARPVSYLVSAKRHTENYRAWGRVVHTVVSHLRSSRMICVAFPYKKKRYKVEIAN